MLQGSYNTNPKSDKQTSDCVKQWPAVLQEEDEKVKWSDVYIYTYIFLFSYRNN